MVKKKINLDVKCTIYRHSGTQTDEDLKIPHIDTKLTERANNFQELLEDIYDDDETLRGKNSFSNFKLSSSRDFPVLGSNLETI